MLSAKEIAAVKVAVEICNSHMVKAEILCAPGSAYTVEECYPKLDPAYATEIEIAVNELDRIPNKYAVKEGGYCTLDTNILKWFRILARKALMILNELCLTAELQKVVQGLVRSVGMNMLTWTVYHEHTFDLSREYILKFLNSSFFTQRGIIDSKKAAEVLVNDKNLSIKQKYKLACVYCFTEHIPVLYGKLAKEDKDTFHGPQSIHQPKLVQFWSFCMMRGVDKLGGQESIRLAVADGSKAAIEYFLEKANLSNKEDFIVDAALEALRNRIRNGRGGHIFVDDQVVDDWMAFMDSHTHIKELYTPSDYYVDILCFLLSRMTEIQIIEFLQKDIEGVHISEKPGRSRVLEYLLDWPYQDYFMRTANLMWEFLPERSYADLLFKIFEKIEFCFRDRISHLKYGEGESYNYKKLLREFWERSPEHYKRYIFCDKKYNKKGLVKIREGEDLRLVQLKNYGTELLSRLLELENFTCEDSENMSIILDSTTNSEKEDIIISSGFASDVCMELLRKKRWETLDKFVSSCFCDKEAAEEYKKKIASSVMVRNDGIYFIVHKKMECS